MLTDKFHQTNTSYLYHGNPTSHEREECVTGFFEGAAACRGPRTVQGEFIASSRRNVRCLRRSESGHERLILHIHDASVDTQYCQCTTYQALAGARLGQSLCERVESGFQRLHLSVINKVLPWLIQFDQITVGTRDGLYRYPNATRPAVSWEAVLLIVHLFHRSDKPTWRARNQLPNVQLPRMLQHRDLHQSRLYEAKDDQQSRNCNTRRTLRLHH